MQHSATSSLHQLLGDICSSPSWSQQLGSWGLVMGELVCSSAELYLLYTCCLWCGGAGGGRVPGLSPAHHHSWVIDWAGTGALPGTAQREHRQSGTWNSVQTPPASRVDKARQFSSEKINLML